MERGEKEECGGRGGEDNEEEEGEVWREERGGIAKGGRGKRMRKKKTAQGQ